MFYSLKWNNFPAILYIMNNKNNNFDKYKLPLHWQEIVHAIYGINLT